MSWGDVCSVAVTVVSGYLLIFLLKGGMRLILDKLGDCLHRQWQRWKDRYYRNMQ